MNQLFPGLTGKELIQALEDNADNIEFTSYSKTLTEDEIASRKDQLSENLIDMAREDDAFQVLKSEHKARIEPKQKQNRVLLYEIKTKQFETAGRLFKFVDQVENKASLYDEKGELIHIRALREDEKQTSMKILGIKAS